MPFCPPAIDDEIEELYKESLALKESLSLEGDKKRRETVELEIELIYRLIAEYSQLGADITIEGETPENLARSRHLEYLKKRGASQPRCPLQES